MYNLYIEYITDKQPVTTQYESNNEYWLLSNDFKFPTRYKQHSSIN